MIQYRDGAGNVKTSLIEVKPHAQTMEPKQKSSGAKPNRRFITEVMTWGVNQAKWKAATAYCNDRKWDFKLLTEKHLT
jgi:hypothetical protein